MRLRELKVVDKDSAVPIYRQLASWITSKITTGDWHPNYQLPGEVDLAKQMGVSRGSLRKAIGLLVERGLLWQVHGRGTFVRPVVLEQRWASELLGTSEELLFKGIPFVTEVLAQEIVLCPERVGELLELSPGTEVVHLRRVRQIEGVPTVFHENFLSADRFGGLLEVDFTKERLLAILESRYGLCLTWADHTVAAIGASGDVATYLGLETGDPLLYNEHIVYDEADSKVELGRSWLCGDRVRLRTAVRRRSSDDVYSISLPMSSTEG